MHTLNEPLHAALARVLSARGYHILTAVQRAVLAVDTRKADILVSSGTGSGKTLAFGLVVARALLDDGAPPGGRPRAIVLTPTRELAAQVHRELDWLLSETRLTVVRCTGGQDHLAQFARLEAGADVVVASPGRLRDHVERRTVCLDRVSWVVLDEADELVRRGFREDVEMVLRQIGPECRTLLFTATATPQTRALSDVFGRDQIRIDLSGEAPQQWVSHEAIAVGANDRDRALVNILRYHQPTAILVFCSRRERVARLGEWLREHGFAAVCLSGALSQAERDRALAAFRSGQARVCVATDLAARGLDVPGMDLVIHADLPDNAQSMIHRSGRTGRAMRAGRALFLVTPRDRRRFAALSRQAGRTIVWGRVPDAAEIFEQDLHRVVVDPVFAVAVSQQDRALADAVLKAHGPDRVATAFGRLWHSVRAAAETLSDPTGRTRQASRL